MPKKILLIEDEKLLSEMYREKFVQSGFKVISADSAPDGLELLKKEQPDLILLDILLASGTGISFLKERGKYPELLKVPVVVFSNYDDRETKKETLQLGAKEYLLKTGYTPQEIVDKIKIYLK